MHDPQTVAFEIGRLVTIWHVDPEKDGTDDSCGWFMRARHGDKAVLEKIARRFEFEWNRNFTCGNGRVIELGLFDSSPHNWPNMSLHGIALNLFFYAAFEVYGSRDKAMKFINEHLTEILLFAENPTDSMRDTWLHSFGIDERETKESRCRQNAAIIYPWILRATRPWYKHPRWHIWHWKLQIHPLQAFKRWAFSRCCKCGKGFKWGESPIGYSWDGTGPLWFRSEKAIAHTECDRTHGVADAKQCKAVE